MLTFLPIKEPIMKYVSESYLDSITEGLGTNLAIGIPAAIAGLLFSLFKTRSACSKLSGDTLDWLNCDLNVIDKSIPVFKSQLSKCPDSKCRKNVSGIIKDLEKKRKNIVEMIKEEKTFDENGNLKESWKTALPKVAIGVTVGITSAIAGMMFGLFKRRGACEKLKNMDDQLRCELKVIKETTPIFKAQLRKCETAECKSKVMEVLKDLEANSNYLKSVVSEMDTR